MNTQQHPQAQLNSVFNVSEQAVTANSKGRMTREQVEHLRELGRQRLRQLAIRALVPVLGLIAYVIVAFAIGASTLPVIILLMGGCLFGLSIFGRINALMRYRHGLALDIETRAVQEAVGKIKPPVYRDASRDMIRVERMTFRGLTDAQLNAFDQTARYRVYYTPNTQIVLSARVIDDGELLKHTFMVKTDHVGVRVG